MGRSFGDPGCSLTPNGKLALQSMQDYHSSMAGLSQERIGRRIKWFRESRKLTQEALGNELGFKDRQTLSEIEAGKRRIAPEELVNLTRALNVEIGTLLDPFCLVGEGGFNFRTHGAEEADVAAFADQAGRWIATYRELGRQAGIAPARFGQKLELTRESSFEDAEDSAEALRARWNLGEAPAEGLERAIERELGALVLYVDAPAGISGAASHLPGLQTILVNRREPESRRIFDLAHELFHILTWDAMPPALIEGLEPSPTKGNRVEQLANVFAASVLMPASTIRARWEQHDISTGGDGAHREWLIGTARVLKVSPIALEWRLVNLALLPRTQMLRIAGESADTFVATPSLFSAEFVARMHEAVETGRLSLRRAAALLGFPLSAFADLCLSYGRPLSYVT